jgi:hypothetical protein
MGLVLQLLGVATVAWNIRGTRVQFSRPGISDLVVQWLARRPKIRPSLIEGRAFASLGVAIARGRGEVWYPISEDTSHEKRIEFIEKNQELLRDKIRGLEQDTENNFLEQTRALEREQKAREAESQAIRQRLEAAQVAGLHVSAMGLAWLVLGMCMSTASVELARWDW